MLAINHLDRVKIDLDWFLVPVTIVGKGKTAENKSYVGVMA